MEGASSGLVAHFEGAQSREGLGVGVLLVSPMGQVHKYIIQLAFPRESCTNNTRECEGLLAGLRIATGMGIFSSLHPRRLPAHGRPSRRSQAQSVN
jgi:ribonuclease HI